MVETRRTSRRLEAKAAADAINSSPLPSTSSKSTRTFRRTPSPSTRAKKEKKKLPQEKNEKENEKLERQDIIETESESVARADGEDNDKDMILVDKTDEKEEERESQNEEKDDEEGQEDKVEGEEEEEGKVEKPDQNQDQIEETKEEQDQNQEKEEKEQDEKKQEPDDENEEKEEEEQQEQEQDPEEEEEEDDEDVSHYVPFVSFSFMSHNLLLHTVLYHLQALLAASGLSFPSSSSSPPSSSSSFPPPAPKTPSTARPLHPHLVSNQLESGASRYQAYFQFHHSKKHPVSLCPAARTVEEQKLLAASRKEVAHSTNQRAEAATKLSAGRRWFNFESEQVTPEALQDFALLKMRTYLDPKKFYKSWDHASSKPKHFQRGTVLEGPQEFHSNRLTKKQRRKTLTDEIMADQSVVEYTHRVAINIQRAGREKKKKRRYN